MLKPSHPYKCIHFIYGLWDNTEMPVVYQSNIELWRSLNPDYRIRIWNKAEVESLVAKCNRWKGIYYKALSSIQKSDIARLLIIWKFGGVYSDLDVCPKKSLSSLSITETLDKDKAVIGIEHLYSKEKRIEKLGDGRQKVQIILTDKRPLRSRQRSTPTGHLPFIRNGTIERLPRISNYWFAAPKYHPFIKHSLRLISDRIHLPIQIEYDILYTTGPDIVSEAFNMTPKSETHVIDFPEFTKYFHHYATGTWRWNKKSQRKPSETGFAYNA